MFFLINVSCQTLREWDHDHGTNMKVFIGFLLIATAVVENRQILYHAHSDNATYKVIQMTEIQQVPDS